jgi:bifunctional DNA-binding transcriptional regulator/antitoxin component of YhaV-PrlF toxin-antitoxin module
MPKASKTIKLTVKLCKSDNEWGWHFLRFSAKSVAGLKFEPRKSRRVVCTLNGRHTFQCALLPWTKGGFCIVVNKAIRDKLGIVDGDKVTVELKKDESKYGLPMPKELKEVLRQDKEGDRLFHALTPGKQRTLLYYIGKWKDVDRRIHYSLIVIDHLKKNEGKVDFPKLSVELKRPIPKY